MRVLVTGGNGFVGGHLVSALRARGDDVVSAGRTDERGHRGLELSDSESVRRLVEDVGAELIFHLAAQAFVPEALASPLATYDINVMGTARVLEAVRTSTRSDARVVVASSAEVYGIAASPSRESSQVRPVNPYGASKAAAEYVASAYVSSSDLDVVIYRGFNQIGPGQDERFAVPSFARQLAEIATGTEPVMRVGNLDAKRDFLDVRDAVNALLLLADRGDEGETYNVCRGEGISISTVLQTLISIANVQVEIREDPERMRPSDNPLSVGDPSKLRERTGWSPQYSLETTLRDVYEDARRRIVAVR